MANRVRKRDKQGKILTRKLNIFDILTCIFFVGCLIHSAKVIIPLGILANSMIALIVFGAIVLLLLHLIIALLDKELILQIAHNAILIMISLAIINVNLTVEKVDKQLEEIIKQPESYSEYISIVALRDSEIISLDQLAGKKIAFQEAQDTDNMLKASAYLEEKLEDYTQVKYKDYALAIEDLYAGKIQAMIISENYRNIVESSVEDFSEKTARIDAIEIEIPLVDIVKKIDITANPFTVLISGMDSLGSARERNNSDINILLTVNPLTRNITMISFPRDSYVPNACEANQYDKLTHTGWKGIDCTVKTIENTFDIEINYYVKVSFSTFINLIDALGGLEINVPFSFCESLPNAKRTGKIYVNKGLQTLDGQKALAFARNRHNVGSDFARAKNQQAIINAIIKKCMSPDIFSKVDDILKVVSETVQMNFSKDEIYSFLNMLSKDLTKPWTISNNVITGDSNVYETCASYTAIPLNVVKLYDEEIAKVKYLVKVTENVLDLTNLTYNANNIEVSEAEASTELGEETEIVSGWDGCWIDIEDAAAWQAYLEQKAAEEAGEIEGPNIEDYEPSYNDYEDINYSPDNPVDEEEAFVEENDETPEVIEPTYPEEENLEETTNG